jgi:hypothetical protein
MKVLVLVSKKARIRFVLSSDVQVAIHLLFFKNNTYKTKLSWVMLKSFPYLTKFEKFED